MVLWGERNTANIYHWLVWGVLAVSLPHWVCYCSRCVCFPSLHCSASRWLCQELFEVGLGCMHFPGLSHSGSGSRVLHKGSDLVGPAFCALPRSKQLRWPDAWRAQSPPLGGCNLLHPPSLLLGFLGVQPARLLRCTVYLSWGADLWLIFPADVDCPESQEVLVSNEACLQFGRWYLSGATIAPFQLWMPLPACLQLGMGWSTAS